MNSKLLRTVLISGSILSAILLWATRTELFPSLSAYANAENVIFYHGMHLFASWFFIMNGAKRNENLDYWIGFGMGGILLTNMYDYGTAHNIITVLTLLLAVFTIIYTAKTKRERKINIYLGSAAILVFLFGYITKFHFLVAEIISMACIAAGMIVSIWRRPEESQDFELLLASNDYEKGDTLNSQGQKLLVVSEPKNTYTVRPIN